MMQILMMMMMMVGGPPTLPDTDLFQSVRNQVHLK